MITSEPQHLAVIARAEGRMPLPRSPRFRAFFPVFVVLLLGVAAPVAAHSRERAGLRARVARGLAISPVAIDTAGLSHTERQRVGLGSYIVNGPGNCTSCHVGPAGFLAGGIPLALGDGTHIVWSRNLTPDPTTGLPYTEAEFLEVIRTGRDLHYPGNKRLVVMPWDYFRWMSDGDLKAIYAYLRAVPPVHFAVPQDAKNDLPIADAIPFPGLYDDGEVDRPLPHGGSSFSWRRGLAIAPRDTSSLHRGHTQAYGLGSYMVNAMTACSGCHTQPDRTPDFSKVNVARYLTGGTVFATPPPFQPALHQVRAMSADLKGATQGFFNEPDATLELFRAIIHTGTHADETPPRSLGFPMNLVAHNLANLLDADLDAIYAYAHALPSVSGVDDGIRQDYARWCAAAADCRASEACASGTHECVGGPCASDVDCDVCQTCGGGTCQAPAPDSACVATAQ